MDNDDGGCETVMVVGNIMIMVVIMMDNGS